MLTSWQERILTNPFEVGCKSNELKLPAYQPKVPKVQVIRKRKIR